MVLSRDGPCTVRARLLLDVIQGVVKSTWTDDMGGVEALRGVLQATPLHQLPSEEDAALLLAYLEAVCGALKRRLAGDTVVGASCKTRPADAMDWEAPGGPATQTVGPCSRPRASKAGVSGAVATARLVGPHFGSSGSAISIGFQNADLLEFIFNFLLPSGHGRRDLRTLSPLSAVCRKWREVSQYGRWWASIASVFPPEWKGQDARLSEDHDRSSVLSQGRRLVRERRVWNGEDWVKGLSINFELVDRQDWRTLLCVTGRLAVSRLAGLNSVTLRFFGDDHVAPAFCVDELGRGGQYQWQGMLDVFSAPDLWGQHEGGLSTLGMRASVRDERTGRTALLWEQGRGQGSLFMRVTDEPVEVDWFVADLPERSFRVRGHPSSVISSTWPQCVAPPRCAVDFYVQPLPHQEGVGVRDELWRVVTLGGEEWEERSSVNLTLYGVDDTAVVGQWVRSLLEG